MTKILLVEDEPNLREGLAGALRESTYEVVEARDGTEACTLLEADGIFDLVLADLRMPGKDGMEVLRHARMLNETTSVIVMTAHGTVDGAVQAMQLGAFDYIQKPFTPDVVELKVRRALEHGRMVRTLLNLRASEWRDDRSFEGIIGESGRMQEIFKTVRKVAPSNATILILGETGTGK